MYLELDHSKYEHTKKFIYFNIYILCYFFYFVILELLVKTMIVRRLQFICYLKINILYSTSIDHKYFIKMM